MNYLQLLKLIPAIIDSIKAVESAVPLSGKGKEKLDAVIGMVIATNDALKQFVPQITNIIGILVKLFNLTQSWDSHQAP